MAHIGLEIQGYAGRRLLVNTFGEDHTTNNEPGVEFIITNADGEDSFFQADPDQMLELARNILDAVQVFDDAVKED